MTRRGLDSGMPQRAVSLPDSSLLAWGRSGLAHTKLHRPSVRRKGLVPRTDLVAQLQASRGIPLVSVMAPTGYGKTTLLAQWAAKDRRPFAWLTLDDRDNDPAVLLTSITAALDHVRSVDPTVLDIPASIGVAMIPAAVHRLREVLNSMSRPTVLVLDNVNMLNNPHCINAIEVLSADVPDRMQVALAGRSWPARSLARMRPEGSVLEVGPKDLTMNERETAQLLTGMGVDGPARDGRSSHARDGGLASRRISRGAVVEGRRRRRSRRAEVLRGTIAS